MTAVEPLRVLSLVPFPPRAGGSHGGAQVIGQLLARTAERHRVAVFNLREPGEPPLDDALRERLDVVEEVVRPPDDDVLVRMRVRASLVLGRRPIWPTQLRVRGAFGRLQSLVARWRPDVVRVEYPALAEYVAALGETVPRLLVAYDLPLEAAENRAQVFGGRLSALEVRAWRSFEQRAFRTANAVVVLTARDAARIGEEAAHLPVVQIPLGAEIDAAPLDPRGTEPQSIVFVANFHHAPNADAITHLVHDLIPRIRRTHPECLLYAVGQAPPRSLVASGGDGIVVTGRVPEVESYLDRAAVVVAPLRLGGGMRVKVLDALAAGKAIVAYPRAVEGLGLTNGVHALVADGEADFAAAVGALLDDGERRASLGTAARAWAVEHLAWDRPIQAYDDVYGDVIERARSRSTAPPEGDHPDVPRDPA